MGRIYQRASRTIAWIGSEEYVTQDNSCMSTALEIEALFSFVNHIYGHCREARYLSQRHVVDPGDWYPESRLSAKFSVITTKHPGWGYLLNIFQRSYWGRLWIVQEFVLAKDLVIQCGRFDFEYQTLEHICLEIEEGLHETFFEDTYDTLHLRNSNRAQQIFRQRRRYWATDRDPESLPSLFMAHSDAICSDFRDKLFGLLGLSSLSCCQEAIDVDYNISSANLCQRFLSHCLNCYMTSRDLSIRDIFPFLVRAAYAQLHIGNDHTCFDPIEPPFRNLFLRGKFLGRVAELNMYTPKAKTASHSTQHITPEQFSAGRSLNIPWKTNNRLLWPYVSGVPIIFKYAEITIDSGVQRWLVKAESLGYVHNDIVYALDGFSDSTLILRQQAEGFLVVGQSPPSELLSWKLKRPEESTNLYVDYWAFCGIYHTLDRLDNSIFINEDFFNLIEKHKTASWMSGKTESWVSGKTEDEERGIGGMLTLRHKLRKCEIRGGRSD